MGTSSADAKRLLPTTLLALTVLMAGCSSSKDDTSGPAPSPGDELVGSLVGQVLDDELQPITAAQVGLRSGTVPPVFTDERGSFRMDGLMPGPDLLYVAAIGYQAMARDVNVVAGEQSTVIVHLSDVASNAPFSVVESRDGLIVCGSGAGIDGHGMTQVQCGATDENQKFLFNYTFGADLAGVLVEMTWTPTQALSRDLVLIVEKDGCDIDCDDEDTFAQFQGCCYLRVQLSADDLEKGAGALPATDYAQGGILQSRTFPAFGDPAEPATLFTQQPFSIKAEFFYHALPDDLDSRTNVEASAS